MLIYPCENLEILRPKIFRLLVKRLSLMNDPRLTLNLGSYNRESNLEVGVFVFFQVMSGLG